MSEQIAESIESWGADVVREIRDYLVTIGKTNTGNLAKSLKFEARAEGQKIIAELKSAEYGEFVRLGVQGTGPFSATNPNRAPKSPFKFGSGKQQTSTGTLTGAIDKWVLTKGIAGTRDERGRFIPRKSLVNLIARSIYRFGIRPTNFVFPFFQRLDELTALVGQEYAQQIESELITQFEKLKNANE